MGQPQTRSRDGTNPGVEGMITFLYYKDLAQVAEFYEKVMGFELTVDQGWAKIYKTSGNAHIGIVDEKRGYHKANAIKPVMLTLIVADVDAWYQRLQTQGIKTLSQPHDIPDIGIRGFLFQDPEGYVIEIQKFL